MKSGIQMSDVLAIIAAYKRAEVVARRARTSRAELEAQALAARAPRGFAPRLERASAGRVALIAEIKKASPSKGVIRPDFDPVALACAYEAAGAACLSVLTDGPSFQGEDAYLAAVGDAVTLPCLRKDFLVDAWQVAESRALGADAILVIMAMVDDEVVTELMGEAARFGMDVLVEVHDEAEMVRAIRLSAKLIGVNNRDLRTFVTDLAVTERLAPLVPKDALLVSESGIHTCADVARVGAAGAKAMLVGESLMAQPDVEAAARALLG
jgi:indole-3-glycerol phosphate synthase